MAGELHLEAVLREGRIRLYLSDFWRRPLPVADVTGAVTLELPEGDQRLALAAGAAALEADTPPLAVPEVAAHVELSVGGRPVEMDFLLPVEATRPGAAGLPLGGCLPVPEAQAGGARPAPRIVMES